MTVTISIAMATFNGAKYLPEQLQSFVEQTRQPNELVVTDDGSTDATMEILEQFRATAPFPVHLHRGANLGVARNFERAISRCSGDLIFISDQDDAWFPTKLERVASEFEADPSVMVVINDQIITDEDLNPTGRTKLQSIMSSGHSRTDFITGCCTTIHRNWAEFALPIPADGLTHDGWLNSLAENLGARRILDEPLQFWRRHDATVTAWKAREASNWRTIRSNALTDGRAGWEGKIERARLSVAHIEERKHRAAELVGEPALLSAVASLRRSIVSSEQRIRIAALPLWRRVPAAVRLLYHGHYRQFSGWKSAAKDILKRSI